VLSLIEDMLHGSGYTVLTTGDPQVALRIARTHPDPIHLLLTDVVMPLMAGSTLCEEFRILRPGARVLFMSGYETVEAYGVRLAPGEPVLNKPADGFYEWTSVPGQRRKHPYFFRLKGGKLFAFAGLYTPPHPGEDTSATFAII